VQVTVERRILLETTEKTTTSSPPDAAPPLPLLTCFGWGLGTLGLTAYMVGSYLLLRFMTDYMAIPAEVAGLIFAGAKLYDGLVDPLFGSLSDRTKTRWGRRRPYMVGGAIACGAIFALAFNLPIVTGRAGAVAMLACMLMAHATAYAAFAVPYMTLPAEMTTDPQERSKLMSFRVVNGSFGNLIGGSATAALIAWFGGGLAGHRAMGIVVGLTIFAVLMTCVALTRKAKLREHGGAEHPPVIQQLRMAVANRPFFILQCAKLALLSAAAFHTASAPFFVQRRLGLSDQTLATIYLMLTIGTVLAQPLWLRATRMFGKRRAYLVAGIFTAMVWLSWLPLGHGSSYSLVLIIGLLAGVGNGGIVLISQSMLPDTMEYQFLTSGKRIEGSFAGLYIMVEKLGQAIGASLTGIALGLFGYVSSTGGKIVAQPASAVTGVVLSYSVFSTCFLLLSVAIMAFYPLDERTMQLRTGKVPR
jgi:GPH family glycoside/pentoside/hexuronide:cation symporter